MRVEGFNKFHYKPLLDSLEVGSEAEISRQSGPVTGCLSDPSTSGRIRKERFPAASKAVGCAFVIVYDTTGSRKVRAGAKKQASSGGERLPGGEIAVRLQRPKSQTTRSRSHNEQRHATTSPKACQEKLRVFLFPSIAMSYGPRGRDGSMPGARGAHGAASVGRAGRNPAIFGASRGC